MVVTAPPSKRIPFFKMTLDDARQDYKAKRITAEAYLLYIIKANRAAGWKWNFRVDDFCAEYEIPRRSFYRAISKLRTQNLVHWETNGEITVWWGDSATDSIVTDGIVDSSDLTDSQNPVPVSSMPSVAQAVPSMSLVVPPMSLSMPSVAQKNAETLTKSAFCDVTDIDQINTHTTDTAHAPVPHPGVCVNLEKEEEQQVENFQGDQPQETRGDQLEETRGGKPKDFQVAVKDSKNPTTPPEFVPEDRNSAAPLNKTSKTQPVPDWCNGTREDYLEFIIYKGLEMLGVLQIVNKVNYRSQAMGWCERNPDKAAVDFESWLSAGKPKSPEELKIRGSAADYDFDKWQPSRHCEILSIYQAMREEDFLAVPWRRDWYEWVKRNKPEKLRAS